jgi:hypothetical protein
MKALILSIIMGSIFIGRSSDRYYLKKSFDQKLEVKKCIVGTWRAKGGIWITFEGDGTFYVNKGKEGKERVFEGRYSIEYLGDTSSSPLIFDCIVLKIKINNPERYEILKEMGETYGYEDIGISIIPVSFYSGEGDPTGLKLLQLANSFGRLLSEYFGINSESLMLSGECVHGGWPEYLEE